MTRKILLFLFSLALLIELVISFGAILAPEAALRAFKIGRSPDAAFLAYAVGWLCLFVSLICGLVLYRIATQKGDYATPGYLLGFWWIALGIGIYVAYNKTANLLLDSLKGLLVVIALRLDARRNAKAKGA